ncbi:MAG: mechanosensitive ion channel family protein [Dermatophilaceae bacterium]
MASPVAAASVRDLSWATMVDWLVSTGLIIVAIVVLAVLLRWLAHRLVDRMVRALLGGTPRSRTSPRPWRRSPPTAEPPEARQATPTERIHTGELPVVRRHARLAARALEEQFANPERQSQRVVTLGSVLRSIATVVISMVAILMVGDQLGLNMAPVLASAGVGGVALGFGAQSLVKDFLSGMFMLAEDQYGVGDTIDTGEAIGVVEDVTLRVTRLRDASGVIWYVRNGEIVRVANRSQGWSTASVDIPVAYDESPERVISVLREAMDSLDADPHWDDTLLEAPKVVGVESVTGGTMTIRIFAKCAPNQHWGVQREIRERGLTACAAAGIRGPVMAPAFRPGEQP